MELGVGREDAVSGEGDPPESVDVLCWEGQDSTLLSYLLGLGEMAICLIVLFRAA